MEQLYHIHICNRMDELFKEGNTLVIGNEPNHFRQDFLNRSCTFVDHTEIDEKGHERNYHRNLGDVLNLEAFTKLPVNKQFEVLARLKEYVINSKIDFRELILEDVRKELYPYYPSRNTCIWLTDKDSLPYWEDMLKTKDRKHEIYEVDTNGKLFVSTDDLLPAGHLPHDMMYNKALQYWSPTSADLEKNTREYLFEGELKLTKRVK